MTYMNCALKLVEEITLYYDARSKKHQMLKLCGFECACKRACVHIHLHVKGHLNAY